MFSIWLSCTSAFSCAESVLTSTPASLPRALMAFSTFWRNWSSTGKLAPIFSFFPFFGLTTSEGW